MKIGKIYLLAFVALLNACQKELHNTEVTGAQVNVHLRFNTEVNGQPLQFNAPYHNSFGEAYSVSTFKYYISAIDLVNTDANLVYHLTNDYYLVDAADSTTTLIVQKAALHKYNRIAFTIGVDSIHNVSGAQTGALDPVRGMFWTWNSGYIMAKLEGNSPLSTEPDHKIEYHIGGFRQPYSAVKRITLPFPAGETMPALPNATSIITISANIDTWFSGTNELHIAATPVCMTPGTLSAKIAENYSGMFHIAGIINN